MITKKQISQFEKILKWVLQNPHSSFYRKKYHHLKTWDFHSLPFLTREEIAQAQSDQLIFVPEIQISSWNMSSGTTSSGDPLLVPKMVHSDPALEVFIKLLNKFMIHKMMILTRLDLIHNRMRFYQAYPALFNARQFILGDIHNLNLTAKMTAKLMIDSIESSPTILHFFIPFLKEVYDLNKIKFICLGGEYTSEQRLKLFKSYFENAYFHFRFGGTENPILKGLRCEYLSTHPPRFFHPNCDFYIYEILDYQDKGVKEGEKGEMVLTTLKKCAFPLIRYKTGDAIIWHTTKACRCGAKDLIEVFGRIGYDFVRISGLTIHIEMLEKALLQIDPNLSTNYQLHVYEVVDKKRLLPKLILHLFVPKMAKIQIETVKKKIESLFYLSPTQTLKDLVEKGIILPLEIKLEEEEKIAHKSVKIVAHLK